MILMYTPSFHFCDVYVCVCVSFVCVKEKDYYIYILYWHTHARTLTHTHTRPHTHSHAHTHTPPTQLPIQKQWWSNVDTQRPQSWQCLIQKTKIQKSVKCRHTAPTVMVMLGTKIKFSKASALVYILFKATTVSTSENLRYLNPLQWELLRSLNPL